MHLSCCSQQAQNWNKAKQLTELRTAIAMNVPVMLVIPMPSPNFYTRWWQCMTQLETTAKNEIGTSCHIYSLCTSFMMLNTKQQIVW